jgi:phosphomethylpyrimidine synthase
MIATKDSFEPHSSEQLPNSNRIYVEGSLHQSVRVPLREITLAQTKSFDGIMTKNDPVRVYDCAGPWGDPAFNGAVTDGLPALRGEWIRARGDVEEYDGRTIKPIDNGYLSETHARKAHQRRPPAPAPSAARSAPESRQSA